MLGIGQVLVRYRLGQMSEAVDIAFGRHDHGSMMLHGVPGTKTCQADSDAAGPGDARALTRALTMDHQWADDM